MVDGFGVHAMPFKQKRNLVFLLFLLSAACNCSGMRTLHDASSSEQVASGTIVGIVKDLDEDPIANASILLKCLASNLQYDTSTNWYGKYVFKKIPPGLYSVCITAYDFQKKFLKEVPISAGTTLRLRSILVEDPAKRIVIRDPIPMINHRNATSGIRVWQDDKGVMHVENE